MDNESCPNCNASNTTFLEDPGRGDIVCGECGCCLPDRIMVDSGNQHFYVNSSANLAGAFTEINDKALNKLQMRLMQGEFYSHTTNALNHLRTLALLLDLQNSVIETAKILLLEWIWQVKANTAKKNNNSLTICGSQEFALALCYFALKKHGRAKSVKEMAASAEITERALRKCIKRIQRVIPEQLQLDGVATMIEGLIRSIAEQLHQDSLLLESLSLEIAQRALTNSYDDFAAKRPSTIAAACIYLAAELSNVAINPEDIATCAFLTVARLLNVVKLIKLWTSK